GSNRTRAGGDLAGKLLSAPLVHRDANDEPSGGGFQPGRAAAGEQDEKNKGRDPAGRHEGAFDGDAAPEPGEDAAHGLPPKPIRRRQYRPPNPERGWKQGQSIRNFGGFDGVACLV